MSSLLKRQNRLDRDIFTKCLSMAWPAIIESFFVSFAGLVDSLMVSSLSQYAVAAVGLTTQPKFTGLALFFATGVSTSAVVARRLGEKRKDNANSTLVTSLIFAIIAAVILSSIFVAGADGIIAFCGSTENTHNDAVAYFKIIMGGMIFNCIQIVVNSAQRGAGNTKITMITNVTSNTVNVILNYLLIGGKFGFPALGIRGAAIATVLGTVVSCVISIISLFRKNSFLSITYIVENKIKPSLQSLKVLCKFGYSIFIEQILLRIGFSATAIMAAKMGDDPMAAHQITMNILSLSFAFGDGLQSAAVALIGRSLGEKDPQKAKDYGAACQLLGTIISIIVAVIFFFGGEWTMSLFFKEYPHIIKIGTNLMRITILIVLFQIKQVVYMGSLRAAGDTLFTAIASTISVTIVRTVVSYICGFVFTMGIVGVWMGILADQLVRFGLSYARFKAGKWANIRI